MTERKTIRQLRQERGWTPQDVAVRIAVSSRSVIRWEGEQRRPQPANRQRLAALFGVSAKAIAFGRAEPAPQDRA